MTKCGNLKYDVLVIDNESPFDMRVKSFGNLRESLDYADSCMGDVHITIFEDGAWANLRYPC